MARIVDRKARQATMSAAVWQVIAEQGIEALSLRAVARAAGCTTGMVLHYFADRQELLLHARHLMHERMLARVVAAQEAATHPHAALRDVLAQSLTLDPERLTEARVWLGFLAIAVHDEQLAQEHVRRNRAWHQRITALVRAARPDLPAAQAARAAQGLVALTDGLATLSTVDCAGFPPQYQRQLLDEAIADLLEHPTPPDAYR